MNKHTTLSTIIFSLLLIGLPLLTGCQEVGQQGVAFAAPIENEFSDQANEQAMINRWQALARFHENQSLATGSLTQLSSDEISAFRWEAMARFYSENPFAGSVLTELNDSDISAYRWLAIARFYEQNLNAGLDLTALSPDEILAYRWTAIAKAYEMMGDINLE